MPAVPEIDFTTMDAATLTLTRLRIINATAVTSGGAVRVVDGHLHVRSCEFENAVTTGSGGALFIQRGALDVDVVLLSTARHLR